MRSSLLKANFARADARNAQGTGIELGVIDTMTMGSLARRRKPRSAARSKSLGRRRHRRRGHRVGCRRRRRVARLSDAAARSPRLRPGDLEPEHQADPRRRALPRPGQFRPGPRGPPRARSAASATPRTWSIAATSWSRPIAGWICPSTASGLKVYDCWPAARTSAARAGSGRPRSSARIPTIVGRRAARRDRLHRRPVRRRPAGDLPGADVRRPGRHGAQLHAGRRLHASATGGSPRSPPATTRPARSFAIEARVGRSTRPASSPTRSAGSTIRAPPLAAADAQPGDAPRARSLVPSRRDARFWSRAPTTAACSSRSPGTTGSWSGRPIRRSPSRPSSRARGGEEIAYLLDYVGAIPGEAAAGRRRPQHVRRPAAAAARP